MIYGNCYVLTLKNKSWGHNKYHIGSSYHKKILRVHCNHMCFSSIWKMAAHANLIAFKLLLEGDEASTTRFIQNLNFAEAALMSAFLLDSNVQRLFNIFRGDKLKMSKSNGSHTVIVFETERQIIYIMFDLQKAFSNKHRPQIIVVSQESKNCWVAALIRINAV